ncbi:hypothetical protein CTAYLR_003894 [Chrysophaeum taylorii]|uniref:Orn/DAP/Arg decarboxylase 2 N-terminal domain-containing protein n=1 Tax=Chrysophaeum taylorii TaxID=2483200 RepID=A0AAD7XLV5_9STRA|nr:hypothetical protein CTAYLR_003894 [Chrysophaeum taylorii]
MESAETSKESAPGPSVTPVDPSVPAELTKVSKKPAAKRQRRKNLLRGECVCCVARLDADETARGQPLDLERLLNIEGELPDKFYVCSKMCRDDFTPSKLHTTKGAKAVLARISASLTRTLKTTIRSGDEVLIEHDFSAGYNIQGGNGVVLGLIYNNTVCRVESYDVKTIQQGEIRVPFSHVKAKPDKENDTPPIRRLPPGRPARPTLGSSGSSVISTLSSSSDSNEVAGAIRARAIIDDKLTVPFRFFAASDALEGWSVLDMAGVLERVHAFFQVCQDNPQLVATAGYAAFDTEIATYAQFLETRAGSAKLSVDGQSTIRDVAAGRARLYAPTDTNDPEAKTMLDALRAWGRGMRRTFEGGQSMRYVGDGDLAAVNQTSELRRAFDGARRNSNEVEGEFGVLKYYNASYVNMSVVNCVGVVACQRDHMFDRAATSFTTKRRRRVADEVAGRTTTKARMRDRVGGGRLATLGDDFRGVLMEAARRGRQNHKEQAAARAEAAKEHHRRRAAAFVEKALERQVNDYAKAQEAMKVKPVVDEQALVGRTLLSTVKKRLDAALKQISSDAARSKVLKENIDRYVVGMGMGDLKPKSYTSGKDPTIGSAGSKANIEFLTAHLEYVYEQIKTNSRELVAEAVVPGERRRQLPVLGTATAQRLELDARRHLSVDELKAKVEECRAFRHPRKRTRTTSGRSKLPTIDVALVGSRVEVLWELSGHPGCYWMPGTIEAVSDENSKDGRKKLGLGWIFNREISLALRFALEREVFDGRGVTAAPVGLFYDLDLWDHLLESCTGALPEFQHYIAVKSNPVSRMLKHAARKGFGAECASIGELLVARERLGLENVVFDSPAKTYAELEFALSNGIRCHVDNLVEFDRAIAILGEEEARTARRPLGFRINPSTVGEGAIAALSVSTPDSKFGVDISDPATRSRLVDAYARYACLDSVHVHVGSGGMAPEAQLAHGIRVALDFALDVNRVAPGRVKVVDIGGGLPVNYESDDLSTDAVPTFAAYAAVLRRHCPELFDGRFAVLTEFGQSLNAKAGFLASRVEFVKKDERRTSKLAVVHFGADLCVRQAYANADHPRRFACFGGTDAMPLDPGSDSWSIGGPLCFQGDFVARDAAGVLPDDLRPGDLLVMKDAGANTLALFSRHCSRFAPPVYGFRWKDPRTKTQIDDLIELKPRETLDSLAHFWGGSSGYDLPI